MDSSHESLCAICQLLFTFEGPAGTVTPFLFIFFTKSTSNFIFIFICCFPVVVSNDIPQTEEGGQSGQDRALSKSKLKKNKKKRST